MYFGFGWSAFISSKCGVEFRHSLTSKKKDNNKSATSIEKANSTIIPNEK